MTDQAKIVAVIEKAFPERPLGRAGKQFRQLVEILSDPRPLDSVMLWPDMVDVLMTDTSLPAKIMFLEPDTWQAFLPAWMVAAIKAAPGDRADDVRSAALGTLDPKFSEKSPDLFQDRKAQLSPNQREAVASFVRWMAEQPSLRHPNSKALVLRLLEAWPPEFLV